MLLYICICEIFDILIYIKTNGIYNNMYLYKYTFKRMGDVVMYSAMDVALYIIHYLSSEKYSVSNLKLQKLLYFVQGFFLCLKDEPCFTEKIEAWDFGPVVPDVYHKYKIFGSNSIPMTEYYEYIEYDDKDMIYIKKRNLKDIKFCDIDEKILDMVLEQLKGYSATTLVNITHKQSPWSRVYSPHKRNIPISNKSIEEYFKERYLSNE